jgi:DNA polymerase-4
VGVIRPQDLPQGIAHLPVRYLWGAGPKTQAILQGAGLCTFGDVQARTLAQMRALLGAHGERLWRIARGEDDEPVTPVRVVKSVSHETTFERDTVDMAEIEGALRELAEDLARRLRARGWEAAEVVLKLRTAPFTTRTRRQRLSRPTASGGVLFTAARTLVDRVWDRSEPVRLVGIQATHLQPASFGQCLLFEDYEARLRRIGELADRVNRRYGRRVMRTAGELGGEARQSRWLRPEREERL